MLGPKFGAEFRRRVDGRIDVAPQPVLGTCQRRHDVLEGHLADHEQVDVTRGPELPTRRGTEHERHEHVVSERSQCFAQEAAKSGGLGKQPAELGKDRGIPVGLEVDLSPLGGPS